MREFRWAPAAYRRLRGLVCVYKPPQVSCKQVVHRIQVNLANDLNALPCYKVEAKLRKVKPDVDWKAVVPVDDTSLVPQEDMADHRLVLGERYLPSDIVANFIHYLSFDASGILLVNLGRRQSMVRVISQSAYLRVYHVMGRFGMATHDFSPTGKIIERTSFHHISSEKLDKVASAIQSRHLRHVFACAEVAPNSQAAYELASQGLVRPKNSHSHPVYYKIKCIHFEPPDFTLEIHSINEDCLYFMEMIHDIGLSLRSTAVCTGIRRLRYGHFDPSHAILRQQWHLEEILDNLALTRKLMTPDHWAGEGNIRELGKGVGSEGVNMVGAEEGGDERVNSVDGRDAEVLEQERESSAVER